MSAPKCMNELCSLVIHADRLHQVMLWRGFQAWLARCGCLGGTSLFSSKDRAELKQGFFCVDIWRLVCTWDLYGLERFWGKIRPATKNPYLVFIYLCCADRYKLDQVLLKVLVLPWAQVADYAQGLWSPLQCPRHRYVGNILALESACWHACIEYQYPPLIPKMTHVAMIEPADDHAHGHWAQHHIWLEPSIIAQIRSFTISSQPVKAFSKEAQLQSP